MASSEASWSLGGVRPSRATVDAERRVRDERVLSAGDLPLYVLLSAVNVAAVGSLFAFWLSRAEWSAYTPAYLFLTLLLLIPVAMFESRWFALPLMRRPRTMNAAPGRRVGVATTFVPGAEPIEMLERTVRALVVMDYPHDTWVLDEGDDPAARELCARLGARHFSRRGVPRYQHAEGKYAARTKHGNYNAWLDAVAFARYDVVVGFDPDHVPEPHFLLRVLGYFDDPAIGYVQAAQSYYNQSASFVARGAAEETYAYYSSIQMCSYAIGYPIVTGCHNAHRVSALKELGGFAPHEADDLLITIHYRAAGWRGVYVPERLAAGLTPVDWTGYLRQQRRWARSVLDVKLRLFPKLARRLPLPERVFSLAHGLYYVHGVASGMTVALVSFMLMTGRTPAVVSVLAAKRVGLLLLALMACDLYRQRFFLEPERERGIHWRAALLRIGKWPHVLLGLLDALTRRRRGYAMTTKVPPSSKRFAAAPAHLAVVGLVGAAWAVGTARGVIDTRALDLGAAALVLLSLAVALSELRSFPPPFDRALVARELGAAQGGTTNGRTRSASEIGPARVQEGGGASADPAPV